MKAVIQVVKNAVLSVDGVTVSETGKGLVIFFGVKKGDGLAEADYFAKKIPSLRVFSDGDGKTNLSVKDVDGEILFVSQFTLYGNCSHGNRPEFVEAESPVKANALYEYALSGLRAAGVTVKKGVFGADMQITQTNDGPFTLILER